MNAVPAMRPAMSALKKIPTSLSGVFILEPRVFGDERGFFFESYAAFSLKAITSKSWRMPESSRTSCRTIILAPPATFCGACTIR